MSDYESSYKNLSKLAGATVHAFKEFGTWQGTWWAYVTYKDTSGWVTGYHGTCQMCDDIEAEFVGRDPSEKELAELGKRYLEDIISTEEALKEAKKDASWDIEADEMVAWINKTSEDFKNV